MAEEKKESKPAPAKDGADKADAQGGKAKGGGIMGLLTKTPVMLGGVMMLEAVVLFAGFKIMGGGTPTVVVGADLVTVDKAGGDTHGKEGHTAAAPGDLSKFAEVLLAEIKAPNKSTGRAYMFDVAIYAVTSKEHEEQVKATIKSREALIKDRVRTIIAQSDPEKLGGQAEPGLETLRRQVKHQLEEIIGEGLVEEVLVPRCNGFRTD